MAYLSPLLQGFPQGCNLPGLGSHLRAQLGRILFQIHFPIAGMIQFLEGCWTKGLSSSLAAGPKPPLVIHCVGLSTEKLPTWQLASLKGKKQENKKEQGRQEASLFVN